MRKTKAKRDASWRRQMLPFVVFWTIGIVFANVISSIWVNHLTWMTQQNQIEISILTNVISAGLVQVFVIERLLKKSMRRWMLYTTLGALAILILNYVFLQLFFGPALFLRTFLDNYQPLNSLALNVPTALLQVFWLRQRVRHAWLWPALTIPLLIASTEIAYGQDNYELLKIVMLLSIGIVQAGLMHYFWQNPKDTEKVKINFGADETSDEERLDRLQDHEQSNPLWGMGDEALQHDTQ